MSLKIKDQARKVKKARRDEARKEKTSGKEGDGVCVTFGAKIGRVLGYSDLYQ